MMNNIYVLYHAHCTDGTGSKYAAWKKFKNNAKYIAVNYGQPLPEMIPNSEVYILDFSYPRDVLEELMKAHSKVVVLDHHKTAEEALRGLPCCTFDMHKSGCVLAWEYFHPGISVPSLLLDIQDRDLWLFKRDNSKSIHAGLVTYKGDMDYWDEAVEIYEIYEHLVRSGNTILLVQNLKVESAVKHKVKVINFLGYKVGVTNSTDFASEIGNGICLSPEHKVDFALVYAITTDNEALCSLRSLPEFDVSAVAKKFGGGGHKNAAGFRVSLETLNDILFESYYEPKQLK